MVILQSETTKPEIILVGGGGHCHSVIDVIELQDKYEILGIVDLSQNVGKTVLGYDVLGDDAQLPVLYKKVQQAVVTIGHIKDNAARVRVYEQLKTIGYTLPVIISPLAYVSKHAQVGEGSVVMHHAIVNAGAKIGVNCIINTKALIEHDAVVENHCHIATAAVINGGVRVRQHSFVGSNVMTKEMIEIGERCVIGGGANILSNMNKNSILKGR
ncbi:MAG: putative acetyltransferase EpsM [Turneriella sp.]|nr:putative acetyltransferase EpsM [Turneriella sp.]